MEEEEEDTYIPIEEGDALVRPMKAFIKGWIEYEKVRTEIFQYCSERWDSVMAFDGSVNVVKSYLEFCLPDALKKQMALCRKYKGLVLDKVHADDRVNLNIARKERANINNLITRLFSQLRKCYGDDNPPFKSPNKGRKSVSSPSSVDKKGSQNEDDVKSSLTLTTAVSSKPSEVSNKSNQEENLDDTKSADEKDLRDGDDETFDSSFVDKKSQEPMYNLYGKRHEEMDNNGTPLQDLYETNPEDIFIIIPYIRNYKDKVIYDPCCGMKVFGNILRKEGFSNIIERDLFTQEIKHDYLLENDPEYDLMITNPPFQNKTKFVQKAYASGLPFVLLLPFETLTYMGLKHCFKEFGVTVMVLPQDPKFMHNNKIVSPLTCSYFFGNFPEIVLGTTTIIYM